MKLTTIIGSATTAVVAAAVLAGPADAVPAAQTGAATVTAAATASTSDAAARTKRFRTTVAVTVTPSGARFYDINGNLSSRGVPVAGKKLILEFKVKGGWKKATGALRTDAAGTVHYVGASRRAGLKYRLSFPGAKRLKASHSVRFLVDPR